MKIDELSWVCDVCGELRPDKYISVYTKDISETFQLPPGTVTRNVKYCNDKLECVEGAKRVKMV